MSTVREIITEAFNRTNLIPRKRDIPADMFISGLIQFKGILQEFSNKQYITAYQNEVDFTLPTETIYVGAGDDAEVIANAIQMPVKVLYKYEGQVDWAPLEFIAYENFYSSAYSDYIVSWQPVDKNLFKLYFKPRFLQKNPQLKLIYNVEMEYNDNDTVSLPTPYIELLTRALAYKLSIEFPRVGSEKTAYLEKEYNDLENSLRAVNASNRIITRGGYGGGSINGWFRSGGFISDRW